MDNFPYDDDALSAQLYQDGVDQVHDHSDPETNNFLDDGYEGPEPEEEWD